MNVNELRVGNICQWNTLASMGIGEFEVTLPNLYYAMFIDPIPLSEDWFLKFGFTKDGDYFSMWILDYKYCFKYTDFQDDWGFYQEYTDSPLEEDGGRKYFVSCGLKYVHQLQNLWFGLLNEELKGRS